jgi:hypothetical protein
MDRQQASALIAVLRKLLPAILILLGAVSAHAQVTLTQGTNFSVDVAADGQLAIDLLNSIWILPSNGGQARSITESPTSARRPRWSPDSKSIAYQAKSGNQFQLWLHRLDENTTSNISDGQFFDQHPDWHPDGERIVYSSDRRETGFDLWELDLATGLTWRISSTGGDETEPAWSADGRDLVYIHRTGGIWSLKLRRHGQPDETLETSTTRLSTPSWRPDGSLITFLRHNEDALSIDMAILSEPLLIRPLINDQDIFVAAVAWRDRQHMLYTANGFVRARLFNSRTSRNIPFRATILPDESGKRPPPKPRRLPAVDEPKARLIVRTARIFDGVSGAYRNNVDIVIDGGRIAAIEARRDRPGEIVVDMGDLTTLPGFVDGQASLPGNLDESLGPLLLSYGITTIVAEHEQAAVLDKLWSGKEMPGPRILAKGWQLELDSISSISPGTESFATSPRGLRYENIRPSDDGDVLTIISGLADARTKGLRSLLGSRQANLLDKYPTAIRRFSDKPRLNTHSSSIVLGSKPNGFPPGIALHAEFLALVESGLIAEQVLRTTGVNAAAALGVNLQLGRIAPGASADLVLVDGDPLSDIDDVQNIVGIVRNGRFFSVIGLIERAEKGNNVE